jgi:hypothetical protein
MQWIPAFYKFIMKEFFMKNAVKLFEAMRSIAIIAIAAVIGFSIVACGDGGGNSNGDNPFVGTWTKDDSGGNIKVTVTSTTWTATLSGSTYNSGTYTYSGNAAEYTITNKGSGSADAGSTGIATISGGEMILSDFSDSNMNGNYSK